MKYKFLAIILSIIIVLCTIILIFKDNKNNEYLINITYSEYEEKIKNNQTFILYIKQTTCTHCQSFTPKFEKVLSDYNIKAYVLNLTNMEKEEITKLQSEIDFDGTPTVCFIEKGKELGAFSRINGDKDKKIIIDKLKLRDYIK